MVEWEIDLDRIARIRDDSSAIAGVVEHFGTEAPVAHCGDWHVGDVVRHLGTIHRWATEIVRSGQPAERTGAAPDNAGLAGWLRAGADELCSVLAATPADGNCWTFGRPPGKAGFWVQRQMLETVVHRFDVEHAVGLATPIPTQLALDGIAEVVEFLFPRQVELGRATELRGRVTFTARDVSADWSVGEGNGGEAEVSGTASALFLMLWKRPHPQVGRSGDAALLSSLDRTALTP